VVALALSDVVGRPVHDRLGSTVPDPTTFAQALAVLERRGVLAEVDAAVRERFRGRARAARRRRQARGGSSAGS
jgi:glycerate-2-kinase